MTHTVDPQLLERPIRILVVGCGGNGSAIVSGLPYLHQAMLAFGHPGGLQVTLIDPDTVSETNCVRQPFCRTEIGFPKAIVLAHRINLFWGLNWQGMQTQIQQVAKNADVDLVIGCVDTRKARRAIDKWALYSRALYWLDLGNNASSGQFVLGQPKNRVNQKKKHRLPTVTELFPEIAVPGVKAGTLHQPESRLSGFGHAHTTAAPRLCFVSRRVLQPGDRTACALADSRGHG
jgi:sulfur-carrier protein adenylyltransferase/sulfurtransferase